MRNRFDMQLEQLNKELIDMGKLCEDAIASAMKALFEGDDEMAETTFAVDSKIDRAEREIENLCMKLLLQQQPVAKDLRVVSAALKMISDMERIGDQAGDIAEITRFLKENEIKRRIHIRNMAAAASKMVTDSVDSFVKMDLQLAYSVMAYDDVVDELFDNIKKELILIIRDDSSLGEQCLDLLMIAKYLERIGDHAVNIAEWVEYCITGVHNNNE